MNDTKDDSPSQVRSLPLAVVDPAVLWGDMEESEEDEKILSVEVEAEVTNKKDIKEKAVPGEWQVCLSRNQKRRQRKKTSWSRQEPRRRRKKKKNKDTRRNVYEVPGLSIPGTYAGSTGVALSKEGNVVDFLPIEPKAPEIQK